MLRAVSVIWALAVLAGMGLLQAYSAHPGSAGATDCQWPSGTSVTRAPDRPTLVLFIDANCPSSRASLTELGRITARAAKPISTIVIVSGGTGRATESIPGVRVVIDTLGLEAVRFGVATSGHALLFDASGRLLFSGGITSARGHEGDSLGGAAVLARIADSGGPRCDAPVFGCPITRGSEENDVRETTQ
jgi:hypothetical protein